MVVLKITIPSKQRRNGFIKQKSFLKNEMSNIYLVISKSNVHCFSSNRKINDIYIVSQSSSNDLFLSKENKNKNSFDIQKIKALLNSASVSEITETFVIECCKDFTCYTLSMDLELKKCDSESKCKVIVKNLLLYKGHWKEFEPNQQAEADK
ncbi:hypothetical protein ABK040_016210 [Willaertia magna]